MTDIMLFAAGLGTRMGAPTANTPKPLIPVAGKPLIDHALALTKTPEIGTVVVNTHYKPDQIKQHLDGKSVTISDESDLLRDTGGGLRHALPLLNSDPILTLNTDAVWKGPNPIPDLLNAWTDEMDCLLLVVPKAQSRGHTGPGNLHLSPDGHLRFGEGHVNTGLTLIRRSALDPFTDPVFSQRDIWIKAADEGRLYGALYPGLWGDVGQPDSIAIAEAMLLEAADV